jgi:nucleotide-binding universal stress UspA family protein
MAIRDLLVTIEPTKAGEARQTLAFNLARKHGAALTGVLTLPQRHAAAGIADFPGMPPLPSDGMISVVAEGVGRGGYPSTPAPSAELHQAEWAESAEQLFKAELRQFGVEGECHVFGPRETEALVELAKSADLAILGQHSSDAAAAGAVRPEAVVVAAGRPVLVVPYAGNFAQIGKHALIAWDDSREAVRAVHDALPLLAGAEAVTVAFIGARRADLERRKPALDRLIRHLNRHGIVAQAEEKLRNEMAISDLLLSRAAELGADLIVAGAYHHSQLREALIGGVSRELLQHMTAPVLLSH